MAFKDFKLVQIKLMQLPHSVILLNSIIVSTTDSSMFIMYCIYCVALFYNIILKIFGYTLLFKRHVTIALYCYVKLVKSPLLQKATVNI